jgi:saccharopine dehydrogenase-like NADP-dependent oxidoreductase
MVECGFTPGLDHITAKNVIDNIQVKGGKISSFKTYSGSLIAESCIDNPWQFKLTEPSLDLINLGKGNNRHIALGQLQYIPHHNLFTRGEPVSMVGVKNAMIIPEEDALYCRKVYELDDAHTVVKGRIVRSGFESIWNLLIKLGFTNTTSKVELFEDKSFVNFLRSLLPFNPIESLELRLKKYAGATGDDIDKLKWIGLFDEEWPEGYREITPAVILQHLLEKKLSMKPQDKDCIVMRHELEYETHDHDHTFTATLIVQGEDQRNSATAKAIGLTAGAAAKAVLLENIKVKGLHTPIRKEIYEPILSELVDLGVAFHVEEKKIRKEEIDTALVKV